MVTSAVHRKVSEYEDDNVGVEAAHRTEQAAEGTARTVEAVRYGRKIRGHGSYDRLSGSGAREAFHSMKEKRMSLSPGAASNPISRWKQKQMIRDGYASARTAAAAGGKVSGTSMAGQAAASFPASVRDFFLGSGGNSVLRMIAGKVGNSRPVLIILGICAMVFVLMSGMLSSCSVALQGGAEGVLSAMPEKVLASAKNKISREDFEEARGDVMARIEETASGILSGKIGIRPLKNDNKLVCNYCSYKAVCRRDRGYVKNSARAMKPKPKKQ